MVWYILRRLAIAAGIALLVLTAIFFVVRAVPGDPAEILTSGGANGQATPEAVEQTRQQLGLDQPLSVQYTGYLWDVLRGDLGTSFDGGRPVTDAVFERLPATVELVLAASVPGVILGLALGITAAVRGGWADTLVTAFASVSVAVPVYVLGVFLVYFLALGLGWFPAGGYASWYDPAEHMSRLVLPAAALAIPLSGTIARMTRSSVLETRRQDWVRTAHSWGLSRRKVFGGHVLRNSLTPITTTIGLEAGIMLGSTVLVERVFSYPGLSALLIDAVNDRDYPIVQGVVITIAVIFILINIAVDALYGVLDPRVRR